AGIDAMQPGPGEAGAGQQRVRAAAEVDNASVVGVEGAPAANAPRFQAQGAAQTADQIRIVDGGLNTGYARAGGFLEGAAVVEGGKGAEAGIEQDQVALHVEGR